jgi:pimeloyl-ACP methyl ester carboxylesterase
MAHTIEVFPNYGIGTVRYNCKAPASALLVFVHGFTGSALDTWNDFPRLFQELDDMAHTDVIFYGYDSVRGQVNNHAAVFYDFLHTIIPERHYVRIVLVAHSLGAIVIRRGLLFAKTAAQEWLEKVRMVLFAPAHRGARPHNLVAEFLPSVGKILFSLGLLAAPVLDDLRPDSLTISNLIDESQGHLRAGEGDFTKAYRVIWAAKEIVVHNEQFCEDPPPTVVPAQTHMSVCKTKQPSYELPIQQIQAALS